jgi:hypothetical protein
VKPTNVDIYNPGFKFKSNPGTVSVIDGSSDKVAAGVIFNVNPANSGKIICMWMLEKIV